MLSGADRLTPFALVGRSVRLEPLLAKHAPGLAAAAAEDRTSYGYTWVPDGEADATRFVEAALDHQATGRALVWAVRHMPEDRLVGSTRFLDLDVFAWPVTAPPGTPGPVPTDARPPTVVEIGSTWYAASVQRTVVNSECKLLLLTHAFEQWKVLRVTLKTDERNERSRRAIERLGAAFEGVRRAHSPAVDGGVRDSAYYSIVASEWPAIRDRLHDYCARSRSDVDR